MWRANKKVLPSIDPSFILPWPTTMHTDTEGQWLKRGGLTLFHWIYCSATHTSYSFIAGTYSTQSQCLWEERRCLWKTETLWSRMVVVRRLFVINISPAQVEEAGVAAAKATTAAASNGKSFHYGPETERATIAGRSNRHNQMGVGKAFKRVGSAMGHGGRERISQEAE